jgi:hypothetical protein
LQVFVNWTEIPGSKIRPTSILLMAFELLTLKVEIRLDRGCFLAGLQGL